jgi:hypothetical protein
MLKSIVAGLVCVVASLVGHAAGATPRVVSMPEIVIEGSLRPLGLPLRDALTLARACGTEVSFAEQLPNGRWRAVCADAFGNEID